jgi:hypothetical protein
MKTEGFPVNWQKWGWLRAMLMAILPQGIAESRLGALEEYSGPFLSFFQQWMALFLQGYRKQILAAFDKYWTPVQGGLVLFCFATAPDWSRTFVALIVVLLMIIIIDAYIHGRHPHPRDGITGAAVTFVFLLAAEALTLNLAPSLSVPKNLFFKGAFAWLPLLAMFRMLSRPLPQPDPNTPLWPGMSPKWIYWRTVILTFLWFFMFDLVILMFVSDQPNSVVDALRGGLTLATLILWMVPQTDRLARRNKLVTLFTDPEKQALERKKETLPQGMTRGEPLYWWFVTFEVLIFTEAAANIGVELWWWLHGGSQASWFRIGASLLAFVVSAVSWRYVKAANRAAAAALQAAIEA